MGHKLDGLVGTPRRLVVFRGYAVGIRHQVTEDLALFTHPVGIAVAHGPVVARRVAVLPIAIAVVGARFDIATRGRCQVQLANQTAIVTRVGECTRHQLWPIRKVFETVAVNVHGAGIHTGEETSAARRADRALAIGVREGRARSDQAVDIRCRHVFVSQSGDRVVALLVGANPKNIRRHI